MHHLVVHPANGAGFAARPLLREQADRLGSRTMTLRLRELSEDERREVQRIARSHTLRAGLVRRAQIIVHALSGLTAEEIASRMELCGNTVRLWLNRCNARGLQGLEDEARPGRPPTYSAEQRSAVITAALTRPSELGLPFACWTLDRLVDYLSSQGITMRRSRISEVFLSEGLKWRQDETWFGARVDPDFAKKRGSSNSSTRHRRRAASSFVSTTWDRNPLKATRANNL
jgi:transposase